MHFFELFFSPKGRIHRAGFVLVQSYVIMGFLVSLSILMHFESLFLIPNGFDIWYVVRFGLALVGVFVSVYGYFVSFFKRMRDIPVSPLWMFVSLIPGSNIVFSFIPSEEGENRFGSDPRKKYQFVRKSRFGLWLDVTMFIVLDLLVVGMVLFLFDLPFYFIAILLGLCVLVCVGVCYYYAKRFATTEVGIEKKGSVAGDFWMEVIMILVIVFFIRSFFITPYQILGPSMNPTFYGGESTPVGYQDGEFILVDKLSYSYFGFWEVGTPDRGDVVVFTPRVSPVKKYLIKRVIGLPGDMLKIENGYIWIRSGDEGDYIQLDEPYLGDANQGNTCLSYTCASFEEGICVKYVCSDIEKEKVYEYRVPEGKYFVVGDNRSQSLDSRQCFQSQGGCSVYRDAQFVPRSQVQGRVLLSLGHFDIVDSVFPFELGSFSWEIKPRWTDIGRSHSYSELTF